jgi:hypothetical protein
MWGCPKCNRMVQREGHCPYCADRLPQSPTPRGAYLWEVWVEGYRATGEHGCAYLLGSCHADTFQEACEQLSVNDPYYESDPPRTWGCHMYPTEKQARSSFG